MSKRYNLAVATVVVLGALGCSDDPNDGNLFDFSPPPVGPICQAVNCLTDMNCGPVDANGAGTSTVGGVCAFQTGNCVQCAEDSDCERFATALPDTFGGRTRCRRFQCVCSTDEYCVRTGAGQVCVAGSCEPCGRDTDCTGVGVGRCAGAGTSNAFCALCNATADCPMGQSCLASRCVECDDEAGIACPMGLFCNGNTCRPCATAANCMDGQDCIDGTCTAVECVDNEDCANNPDGPICNGNQCTAAACSSDADCPAGLACAAPGTPDAACVCNDSADCSDDPAGGGCLNPGTLDAVCSCSTDADCAGRGGRCVEGECRCDSSDQCTVTGGRMFGQCRNL